MSAPSGIRAFAESPASPRHPLRVVPCGHAAASDGQQPSSALAAPALTAVPSPAAAGAHLTVVDEGREICTICRSTVQAAVEVLAGTRPVQQLARRLDQRCLASLQHRAALTRRVASGNSPTAGRLHRNPSVRSVRACRISADIYEASAVVVDELRVRAVALRLERSKLVWRVTALEIG
ncbi:Rv3235 family protein [Arthrobacter sp. UYCu712]|uniref:Rv3235 family protein n=1 Tax=Arthrobacter sp. UYCu712 TaxID=3156340 RepID=UPI0033968A65